MGIKGIKRSFAFRAVLMTLAFSFVISSSRGAAASPPDPETPDIRRVMNGSLESCLYGYLLWDYDDRNVPDASEDGAVAELASYASGLGVVETVEKDGRELLWWKDAEWLQWQITVPQDGLYEIEVSYYIPGVVSGNPPVRSVAIDGKSPFSEAENILFPFHYKDAGEPKVNEIGDEIKPRLVILDGFYDMPLRDIQGLYAKPLRFELTTGSHELRVGYVSDEMYLAGIKIKAPEQYLSYGEYSLNARVLAEDSYNIAPEPVVIQAESSTVSKNDLALGRLSNGDPACEPQSVTTRKLNVIGDYYWRTGGQSITWELQVPETGLYQIAMRCAQYWNDGVSSFRQIAIDGKVPFEELLEYEFTYARRFRNETLGGADGKPYLFYLEAGKTHTLTMTVVMGNLTPMILGIYEDSEQMSSIIRSITRITGIDPDVNYVYFLDAKIPDLLPRIRALAENLQVKVDYVSAVTSRRTMVGNNLVSVIRLLNELLRKPDVIHLKLRPLSDALGTLGSWYQSLQEQPLVIDYFVLAGENERIEIRLANIFDTISAVFRAFVGSYFRDYSMLANTGESGEGNETIEVWLSHGRDWAELIKELADELYTPVEKVNVKINILPQSQLNTGSVNALMLSIASGKQPDVALGIDRNSPVEFAIRDAAIDLRQFESFEKVTGRFPDGTLVPFEYRGGTFALPETIDFRVFIYRTDIFRQLGINVPSTWDELCKVTLPVLISNNMLFYYPQDFTVFLFQHGGAYYTEDGLRTALNTPNAIKAFEEYCGLFTDYAVPALADFYMRMRTGEMPCGIGGYGDYIKLMSAAPELHGKWAVAPLLGIEQEDGSIDRTMPNVVSMADMLLAGGTKTREAWSFLEWWSSEETQTLFGRLIEAKIGKQARWNSANISTFGAMPWNQSDLRVILDGYRYVREVPVVLGGYITGRNVANAWNNVILNSYYPRYALEEVIDDLDRELAGKQAQYRIDQRR